jgi:hypothetical protein
VEESSSDAQRVCCPDDLCTGALDAHGRCGTCGRSFDPARESVARHVAPEDVQDLAREGVSGPDEPSAARVAPAVDAEAIGVEAALDRADPDEGERVCCPDDLCTGALDALGRCGTCGRLVEDIVVERG